jgi:2-aminobenzoate-CoA ligase
MTTTAHVDTFARDHLPPREQWPEFVFTLPQLQYPARFNCAAELLDGAVVNGHGARPAIVTPERRLSYDELLAEANRIANVLRDDLGVVPGNRVLLRGFNNDVMAACWLAVVKAGAVVVTTMPMLRAKELTDVVNAAQISHAICDLRLRDDLESALPACPALRTVVFSHDDRPAGLAALAERRRATFANADTAADDVCMIAFTSGTTGKPKGTMHFHRDVLAICDTFPPSSFAPLPDDVFVGTPPLAFTYGLGGALLFPLRAGASTVLLEKPSPDVLLDAIRRFGATVCFTAPTSYRAMAPLAKDYDLRRLRACVSAGETLPVATRALWENATGVRIIDGIGSTEMLHIFIAASGDAIRPGATGVPVPGYVACIIDDDGAPLPPGNVGRLAVKGPTGCRYLADPRQRDYVQNGWNVTGDAYLLDDDGYFWYQARTDDMIISSGYNIAGPEVEGALLEHPRVLECAVVGIPDEARGSIVKAFVVLNPDVTGSSTTNPDVTGSSTTNPDVTGSSTTNPDVTGSSTTNPDVTLSLSKGQPLIVELQEFVKARIAPYKYPRAIEFVDELPRTETGKLQRFKLRTAAPEEAKR